MGSLLCSHKSESANGEAEANLSQAANHRESVAAAPQPEEESYSLPTEPSFGQHLLPFSHPPKERQLSSGRLVSSQTLPIFEVFSSRDFAGVMSPEENRELAALRLRLQSVFADEDALLEGEVLRYKPAAGQERYVKRWGVLTTSKFMYYKNQLSALMGDRPLVSLALKKLVSVLVCGLHRTKDTRFKLELVTTETVVDSTDLHNFTSRSSGSEKKEPGHLLPKPLYLLPGSPSRSPLTQSIVSTLPPLKPASMSIHHRDFSLRSSKVGWTARENEMYRAETRLLFAVESYYQLQQWRLALESVSLGCPASSA